MNPFGGGYRLLLAFYFFNEGGGVNDLNTVKMLQVS
jgi:hypothetical protein